MLQNIRCWRRKIKEIISVSLQIQKCICYTSIKSLKPGTVTRDVVMLLLHVCVLLCPFREQRQDTKQNSGASQTLSTHWSIRANDIKTNTENSWFSGHVYCWCPSDKEMCSHLLNFLFCRRCLKCWRCRAMLSATDCKNARKKTTKPFT